MKTATSLLFALTTLSSHAALVAYWNFNDLSIGSSSAPGSGGVPTSIVATQGSGTLDLGNWGGTVNDYAGSTLNAEGADPAGNSLSLIAASGTTGNGTFLTLQVSLSGLANPLLEFATQGTATGFTSNQLAWSVDGSTFTDFGSAYDAPDSYALQSFDLSTVDALDHAASAWLRLTFDGATGTTGNNRLDNLRITTTPAPEPSALMLVAGGSLLTLRRRRNCALES